MEVNILCPTQATPLQPVQWNHEEVKQWLSQQLESYTGRVYTEKDIPTAKSDRAKLNHVRDALDQRRKDVKKMYLDPYTEFECQVKELVGMVEQCSGAIDAQVKAFEQAQKDAKLQDCKDIFAEWVKELNGQLSFDKIYNPRWLNKSFSLDAVEKEIRDELAKIRANLVAIKAAASETDLDAATTEYLQTLDLAQTIQKLEAIKRQREIREAAKQQAAPTPTAVPSTPKTTGIDVAGGPAGTTYAVPQMPLTEPSPLQEIDFRVWVTNEQKVLLREFLLGAGIRYGNVPKNN